MNAPVIFLILIIFLVIVIIITPNAWGAVEPTEQDKEALKPLQNLCSNFEMQIDCASIKYLGNETIVLTGDENIYKQDELVYNPGLWPIVDYFIMTKQMILNTVIFDESDRNSYRIILSKDKEN